MTITKVMRRGGGNSQGHMTSEANVSATLVISFEVNELCWQPSWLKHGECILVNVWTTCFGGLSVDQYIIWITFGQIILSYCTVRLDLLLSTNTSFVFWPISWCGYFPWAVSVSVCTRVQAVLVKPVKHNPTSTSPFSFIFLYRQRMAFFNFFLFYIKLIPFIDSTNTFTL